MELVIDEANDWCLAANSREEGTTSSCCECEATVFALAWLEDVNRRWRSRTDIRRRKDFFDDSVGRLALS